MASKKPTPFEHPPRADSSSDDDDDDDEQLEEDDSEEPEEDQPKITEILSPEKKPDPKPDSSEDDGSDSGSDSYATPPAPDLTLKQLASANAPAAVSKSAKKRPIKSKTADVKNTKKFKKVSEVEDEKKKPAATVGVQEVPKVGEDSNKQLFQRLFSEEDEIQVLKRMLDYAVMKGIDPAGDLIGFHDYVKQAIHVDVTRAQLNDKIRRLRKKFVKNLSKSKKKGVDRSFRRLHEQMSYDLSKKIWGLKNAKADGDVNCGGSSGFEVKSNGKKKRTPKPSMTPDQKEKHALSLQIPLGVKIEKEREVRHNGSSSSLCLTELTKCKDAAGMGLSVEFFKKGLELLDDEVKAEFEEKWKALLLAEGELYHKRMEINREQVKLILDAYKASGR